MKLSGRIFFLFLFSLLYCWKTSHAIYDPRERYPVKPPKHRELIIPWYLSEATTESSIDPEASRWDESRDSHPKNPLVVHDGSRDEISDGRIEQQTITDFRNSYDQYEDRRDNSDFPESYDQYQKKFYSDDDIDNTEPYEEFAIETKKSYKDTELPSVETISVAKYDPATGAECPTADATGQFVYPPDCKFFVNCWNGRAFVQPCAPGTLFNPKTLECDFPNKVNCYSELGDLTDSHNVEPPRKKESLQIPGSRRDWREPASDEKPSCPSWVTGLLPHPNDCTKFLQCDNGATFVMDCGPGTVFNPIISVCDWPHNVRGCGGALKSDEETTTVSLREHIDVPSDSHRESSGVPVDHNVVKCPEAHEGLLPHPNDCNKFLQCSHGITYVMDCGPGTVYNPMISVCDFPYNVDGCGQVNTNKHEPTTVTENSNFGVNPYGEENFYEQNGGRETAFDRSTDSADLPSQSSGQNFNDRTDHGHNDEIQGNNHPNRNFHPYYNNDNNNDRGQTYGHADEVGKQQTESPHSTDSNSNWNLHNHHEFSEGQNSGQDRDGSYSHIIEIEANRRDGQSHGDVDIGQYGSNQNTYVDSDYRLPGEVTDPIRNENGGDGELPTTPVPRYRWQAVTTFKTPSAATQKVWNQEETDVRQPGKFGPSTWRGQDKRKKDLSNSTAAHAWHQGSKTVGLNKNIVAESGMTSSSALPCNRKSMFNNKTKSDVNPTALIINASRLLRANETRYLQCKNNSDALHSSLINSRAITDRGYGLEYWRATEGDLSDSESQGNVFNDNFANNNTSDKEMVDLYGGDTIIGAVNSSDPFRRTLNDSNNQSQIKTTDKFHAARNDWSDSTGKTDLYGPKAGDRELDFKLDQWAMKTNVFNHARKRPTGTKTVKRGKQFSVAATDGNKNDNKNSNNPRNKTSWYPGGINVISNGIKGHYITREIEINQGHSNTRKYGNQNAGNNLATPNDGLRTPAPHGNPSVASSDAGTTNINRSYTEPLDQILYSNLLGSFTNDNDRSTDKPYHLSATETNHYPVQIARNNTKEKTEPVSDRNHGLGETLPQCNPSDNDSRNCMYINNLTEGERDYQTTDRNTPYVQIKFNNDKSHRDELNETKVESTKLESSIPVRKKAVPKYVEHDKNFRKPKLVFQNKTMKEDSKTSAVMKITEGDTDLNIFAIDFGLEKEEPSFPVYYVPSVEPIGYSDEVFQITPISGQVLRLRGGSVFGEGYLEAQGIQPGWGIVCDRRNEWTLKEANVVCRQFGFARGAEMAWQGRNMRDGSPSLWIAADSVRCIGNETYFQSCEFTHGEECDVARDAVGIRCVPNRVAYCKEDEVPYRGYCYHLANSDSALNHAEALGYCNDRGSVLLDVIDQTENNFVSEWLVENHSDVGSVMTSGFGFTTLNRTIWLWEDSNRAKFRFTKWWPGWLSDLKRAPSVGVRPACVVMKRNFPCHNQPDRICTTDYFFWDVEDCAASSKGHSYVCKKPYTDIGCVYGKGQHYLGKANITASGLKCLSWGDESVQQHLKFKAVSGETREKLQAHNYCRNPNPNREMKPWCFTGPYGEYEQCDIPSCAKQGMKRSIAMGQCKPKHFECTPGECIPSPWICDGEEDCTNGADEQACGQHLDSYTKIEKHRLDGYDVEKWLNTPLKTCALRCKEADFTCRSFSHKADGNVCLLSDNNVGLTGALQTSEDHDYYELNERSIVCDDMFTCGNRKCVNNSLLCDGKNDCGDRTDESNCSLQHLGYEVRLSGSSNAEEGRLEVKVYGRWGQVCDDSFGMIAAGVACKELGFSFGAREVRAGGFYGASESPLFLIDQIKCRGNETSLRECDFDGWGVHNCLPEEAVGIVCKTEVNICPDGSWKCDNSPECIPTPFICDEVVDCGDGSDEGPEHCEAPFELRLSGGGDPLEGRVEVRHHGIWGTVCDDDFSDATARVICRSLGYGGSAVAIKDGAFGPGEGPIWLDQVFCLGNETQLYKCDHERWGRHNCGHDEDAGVRCEFGEVIGNELNEDSPVPEQPEFRIENILPADCGKRVEDFDEDDEYMAKVVQGTVAPKGSYPWQASLRVRGHSKSNHWCGAVIISPRYVLTAAHCLEGYNKGMYFVRAGDYHTEIDDGTEVEANIEDYYVHEDFRKGQRMNNDIALVVLKGRGIPLGRNIMPICLPSENAEYLPGLNCTISGWGSIESGNSVQSNYLRFGWVPILDQSVCQADYVYGEGVISDGMVCAGHLNEGVDSCDGDSGGPLACYHNNAFTLYGLTSWGKHCGKANKPGVYVRVAHYRRWIDKKIQESTFGM